MNASELVQLKLNIEASDGDSTPPEVPTRTYRSGVSLKRSRYDEVRNAEDGTGMF
jgi:hypothetical protein